MDDFKTSPPPEAKLHFLDYWRVIRIRKAIIITVFLITAIIATAVTFVLPESYSSTARIKVENDVTDIPGFTGSPNLTGFDPYFIQTTFEIMQSELVLSNVIASLNLNTTWGQKYANGETLKTTETMAILKQRMLLAPVKNTKLISITVYSEDKKEAADLANAIASAYHDYRVTSRRDLTTNGVAALVAQFQQQEHDIRTNQDYVDMLRQKFHITDQDPHATYPSPTMDVQQLQIINAQRIEQEKIYNEQLVQLQELKSIETNSAAKLRDVLPQMVQDGALNELLSRLHETEAAWVTKTNDYSLSNIEVQRVQSLITILNHQIDDRVVGIMAGLESKVNSTKAALDAMTSSVDEAKRKDEEAAKTNQPYYDAQRDLQQKLKLHELLYSKLTMEQVDAELPEASMVQITDPAEPGKAPVKPNKPVNIALGLIFGLVMGVGLAFFIEYLDTSVKTIDDVERTFQAPVLGVIPQNIGYLLEEGAESKHAEAYRVLRTNLLFSRKDEKLNTIVIVSAGAGEGKSTTTINLATVFAQAGNRVLVVDSDLRRPTLHKLFKVTNNLGLTNYLLKQNQLIELVQTTPVPNLDFMASGRLPNSSMGILGSAQMKEMISELKQRYDFILFDSPPILGVSDASILASEVDLVMQVVQYRRYPQPMTIRAKQMIEKVGGNFVGLVLNNINMSQDEGYYYYSGYYHDYYYSRTASEQEAEAKADAQLAAQKADQAAAAAAPQSDTNIKQKY
jgi:capsular exopolysaccharide synthesis family protein